MQKRLLVSPELFPADKWRGGGAFLWCIKQFWHAMTLLAYAFFLAAALWSARNQLEVKHGLLVMLVGVQMWFYFKCFVWNKSWPGPRRWRLAHFGGGLLICFVQQTIAPDFRFLPWTYFGHTFSMIFAPPIALAYMALVIALFAVSGVYWGGWTFDAGNLISFGLTYLALAAFYLSNYRYATMSEERANLIDKLQAANAALEAARQSDAELATLRERERIARDMHDNLGHTLVAMTVQLEAIQRLYKVDAQRGDAQVAQLKQLTRESMAVLRRSLDGLRAPGLGERALPQALPQLCVAVAQRSGLSVQCAVDEAASELPHDLADAVWGVAQEALTNIEKHAKAKHADVQLRVQGDTVQLRISDDGIGINQQAIGVAGHYGLLGMRERVMLLGGKLSIQNNPNGSGTLIEAIFLGITKESSLNP